MKPLMPKDDNASSVPVLGLGDAQTINGTSSSAQSTVLDASEISVVRIKAQSDVWVKVGENPTAQVEGTCSPYSMGETDNITIPANNKIAVYGGKLTVTKRY